jgi:hypothetical protein
MTRLGRRPRLPNNLPVKVGNKLEAHHNDNARSLNCWPHHPKILGGTDVFADVDGKGSAWLSSRGLLPGLVRCANNPREERERAYANGVTDCGTGAAVG